MSVLSLQLVPLPPVGLETHLLISTYCISAAVLISVAGYTDYIDNTVVLKISPRVTHILKGPLTSFFLGVNCISQSSSANWHQELAK